MDDVEEMARQYSKGCALRAVAKKARVSHGRARKLLEEAGVTVRAREEASRDRSFTNEHKTRLAASRKKFYENGGKNWNKGKTLGSAATRRYIKARVSYDLDPEQYEDLQKLLFLTRYVGKWRRHFLLAGYDGREFIDHFYQDESLWAIHALWLKNNRCKWMRPSLDHKTSKQNGGTWCLSNLRFVTWFENRAKAEMSLPEWLAFRRATGTRSELFIESIMRAKRLRDEPLTLPGLSG